MEITNVDRHGTPQTDVPKLQRLIVFAAFKRTNEGELVAVVEPREMPSETAAVVQARIASALYDGAIAWYRDCDVVQGEFDDAVVLFQHGDVPPAEFFSATA